MTSGSPFKTLEQLAAEIVPRPRKHVLVVANLTAMSDRLLTTLQTRAEHEPTAFRFLVPASPQGSGREHAADRLMTAIERLRARGLSIDGRVADCDPLVAVSDAWDPRHYDEIIICTLPLGASKWLGAGLPERIARLTGAPVTHIIAEPQPPQNRTPPMRTPDRTRLGPLLSALTALGGGLLRDERPGDRRPGHGRSHHRPV